MGLVFPFKRTLEQFKFLLISGLSQVPAYQLETQIDRKGVQHVTLAVVAPSMVATSSSFALARI